jgi:hypothetical protein
MRAHLDDQRQVATNTGAIKRHFRSVKLSSLSPNSMLRARCILCPHACGHSSRAGECADWRCHRVWNEKPEICPSRAHAAGSQRDMERA